MAELITVAIPAYNHEQFIAETLESVLSQDVELEVVVVDDASTDRTAAIAESYAAKDARVKVVRHAVNLGPSAASNEYLKHARGTYLATLPSDDAFAPGKLKAQLDYMTRHPNAAMVTTGVTFIDERSDVIAGQNHFAASHFDTKQRTRAEWLRYFFNVGNNICATSLLIRTELYRQNGMDNRLLQLQDYDCWIRFVLAGHEIGVIDAPLTRYRIRDNQMNLSAPGKANRARNLYEHTKVLNRYHALISLADLRAIVPDATQEVPVGVLEEVYVQHLLSLHAWVHGSPQHRMFALENWYRLLGHKEWAPSLEALGITVRFFAAKEGEYPLAEALALTPQGILRTQAEKWLPAGLRYQVVRRIKARRAV